MTQACPLSVRGAGVAENSLKGDAIPLGTILGWEEPLPLLGPGARAEAGLGSPSPTTWGGHGSSSPGAPPELLLPGAALAWAGTGFANGWGASDWELS